MDTDKFIFVIKVSFFDEYYCEVTYREILDENYKELLTNFVDDFIIIKLEEYISPYGVTINSWEWCGDSPYFSVHATYKEKFFDRIKKEIKLFFDTTFQNIFEQRDYFEMKCQVIDISSEVCKEINF